MYHISFKPLTFPFCFLQAAICERLGSPWWDFHRDRSTQKLKKICAACVRKGGPSMARYHTLHVMIINFNLGYTVLLLFPLCWFLKCFISVWQATVWSNEGARELVKILCAQAPNEIWIGRSATSADSRGRAHECCCEVQIRVGASFYNSPIKHSYAHMWSHTGPSACFYICKYQRVLLSLLVSIAQSRMT